ncbi:hypothetical protein GXB81_17870 [Paraburkholderia sp. Ac-20336]|uniref:hypothetical protein n=1 Tax=Burkholderiaceae TaxID=119060 RepID=UPI0014229FF0|nr:MULTISPECIES: hypothetical protein [Burkholderiaceae]MBN3804904.1 hypothetical protein [Paraburkholderia sp. Ac-20336]NIF53477.1 hypothetical protein [Burkholderia sp. Ax-1724]NIF76880.1 hypothetical protein [Paraburkholderia sp. Cy-641]
MKSLCFAAVLFVLTAGCTSTSSSASDQAGWSSPAHANSYILHTPEGARPGDGASRPPRLTVGTSYSDTQLILPWFLNDIIDFVNYR